MPPASDYLTVTIHPSETRQEIIGFGASDAWSTQFVGKNWPEAKRQQMADWLFSKELDPSGNPKGIGLSMWRFNLGGGSQEQGAQSDINDEWRRAESFLSGNGQFNSSAHQGQRWFLAAAKDRGVEHFAAFVNSPPVYLTKNNKAYNSGGSSANISSENYSAFADYLVESLELLNQDDNIQFDFVNPFNEPQWDWTNPSQEGSPWRNSEIANFVRILNARLESTALPTEIQITEAAQLNFLTGSGRSGRDNQLLNFFDNSQSNYVGDLSKVSKLVAGHSYYTTWGLSDFVELRQLVAQEVAKYPGLGFDMSEYCPLEDNPEINGNGRDLGIDMALYCSRVIHTDLVEANARSWQWWLAISPYDYKDGLVYIDKNKNDGDVLDSKMLWALGNYSRFIRPGAQRIVVSRSDLRNTLQTLDGIMVSAFQDTTSGKFISVVINYSGNTIPVNFKLAEGDSPTWELYRTSAIPSEDLAMVGQYTSGSPLEIPPRSITTLVSQ